MNKNSAFLDVLSSYFTEYLPVTKGLSCNSIRSYKYSLQLLFRFLKEEKGIPPEKVTFHTLEKCRSCSISTRNQRLSCISSFSKYAARKEPVPSLLGILFTSSKFMAYAIYSYYTPFMAYVNNIFPFLHKKIAEISRPLPCTPLFEFASP
jgi:hypothetical protein